MLPGGPNSTTLLVSGRRKRWDQTPGIDEQGALRRFVNVFVADDDIRFLQGLDTPVPAGETVAIIPAVAGG